MWKVNRFSQVKLNRVFTPDVSPNTLVIQKQDEILCLISKEDREAERYANLIAAAPELLAALEETLSCIDQHTDDPILAPLIEYSRKAIAKARGES